jgi:peptidoglycan/LPS O-acetylase OafA/YrhL
MQAVAARYFRLAPPIAVVSAAAYLLMKLHLMFNVQAAALAHFEAWLGLFYTFKPSLPGLIKFVGYNVFFHYEPSHGYNSNLWTMPIEFQGSMLVFSIVAVFVTSARRSFFTLPIAAAAAIFLMQIPTLSCFIFGYVLAECYHSPLRNQPYVRYLAPVLLPLVVVVKTMYPYYATPDALDAVLAASLVFSIVFTSRYASVCSSRLSAFMGQISFPLYLVQIPLICSYTSFLLVRLHAQGLPIYQIALIDVTSSIVIALFIAWLMIPVERFSVRLSARAGAFLVRSLSISREATRVGPTAAPESRRLNA